MSSELFHLLEDQFACCVKIFHLLGFDEKVEAVKHIEFRFREIIDSIELTTDVSNDTLGAGTDAVENITWKDEELLEDNMIEVDYSEKKEVEENLNYPVKIERVNQEYKDIIK